MFWLVLNIMLDRSVDCKFVVEIVEYLVKGIIFVWGEG